MRSVLERSCWRLFGGWHFAGPARRLGVRSLAGTCLLIWAVFPVDSARGEDFFWNAGQPYNEGPWVGGDYIDGYPDRPCGRDSNGYPIYTKANYWQRSCCSCTYLPYPNGPSDQAFMGNGYNVNLYRDCAYPDCNVSVAALDMGWKGHLGVYADLAVAAPMTVPPSCMLSLYEGCSLNATIINQGELDGYMNPDEAIAFTGSIKNTGRMYISGIWHGGAGSEGLTNSGAGFIDSESFDTDLPVTNAGSLWSMASGVTLRNTFTQTAGTLLVNGSSYSTSLNNYQPLSIQGGMVCGEGPITGHVDNSGGTVAPGYPCGWWFGSSIGRLVVGSLTQGSNGTIQVRLLQGDGEILYPTQQADQVVVTGQAVLAGTLNVIHAAPQLAGERYIVVSAAGVSGQFDQVTGPGSYSLTYEPARVILTVIDPGGDQSSPTVAIDGPTVYSEYTTGLATVNLSGTALDGVGVASVEWASGPLGGACVGTMDWSASGIPLQPGRNMISITARDAAGNEGVARLAVTRICPPWDIDCDGHVDRNDVEHFVACVSGPAVPAASACMHGDFDNDGDVDQSDFGFLQRCYSGPNALVDPDCGK